jgi:hypothetical protein
VVSGRFVWVEGFALIWDIIGHETPEREFTKNFMSALVCSFDDISIERSCFRGGTPYSPDILGSAPM